MLFSNILAKTSDDFAPRHTVPPGAADGAVFTYGESFDIYVHMCVVFMDSNLSDESEPLVEVRSLPRCEQGQVYKPCCHMLSAFFLKPHSFHLAGPLMGRRWTMSCVSCCLAINTCWWTKKRTIQCFGLDFWVFWFKGHPFSRWSVVGMGKPTYKGHDAVATCRWSVSRRRAHSEPKRGLLIESFTDI